MKKEKAIKLKKEKDIVLNKIKGLYVRKSIVISKELKSVSLDLEKMLILILEDLRKNLSSSYNCAAAQRVRVNTITLQKIAKYYRELSVKEEKKIKLSRKTKLFQTISKKSNTINS